MKKSICLLPLLLLFAFIGETEACTNFLITKGASVDGSTFITYCADSHIRYGELYFTPAADWPQGSMRICYDRSTNAPRGSVPQPPHTYQVLGYINENQVALGETTFGGREDLIDPTGIVDYGSLMFIALERSRTAREAIKIMANLVEEYGYGSDGESFSISDANEVWHMEIMPKGFTPKLNQEGDTINADRGAVWVAIRIPDGYISGHANAARITTFPLRDGRKSITDKDWKKLDRPEVEVIYKHDVIDFARRKGYFKGKDADFDFSAAYAPVDFSAARICDLRVWMMFNAVCDGMEQYWAYATGEDLTHGRMPLYVKPNRKISLDDIMGFMRNHYQDTELDKSKGPGAGPFGSPFRSRRSFGNTKAKPISTNAAPLPSKRVFRSLHSAAAGYPTLLAASSGLALTTPTQRFTPLSTTPSGKCPSSSVKATATCLLIPIMRLSGYSTAWRTSSTYFIIVSSPTSDPCNMNWKASIRNKSP